jgi:hypothetical protein
MQSIPNIVGGGIAPDDGMFYKLKINTITVTGYMVANYPHTVALPAMDTIAAFLLLVTAGAKNSGQLYGCSAGPQQFYR